MGDERKNYDALYRLLSAWLHGESPEEPSPDWEGLFRVADRHLMTAAVCIALEKTGLMDRCPADIKKKFTEGKTVSVYMTLLMDAERQKLLAFMEEQGIWYLPLKGIVLKELYPQLGARQMSDNDILIDVNAWKVLRDHMRKNGYKWKNEGAGAHDTYVKQPVYRFEMHRKLFVDDFKGKQRSAFAAYYETINTRMQKDEGNRFGYHLSDEDFYIYFLAHAYRHYSTGGTGIRTLLDLYVYRLNKRELDEDRIAAETDELGIRSFEMCSRTLAEKLFSFPSRQEELTEEEARMLAWMESSGVFGTTAHHVQNGLQELEEAGNGAGTKAKCVYLLRRVFPDLTWYRFNEPFVYRHRWLIPFFWVYRLFRGTFVNGVRNLQTLRIVASRRKEDQ